MPMLGIAKERLAGRIGSAATKGEGRQNMLCAYLAAALLVGLVGNALLGAWWLDPLVGLLIAAVAVREGIDARRGEGCCVVSPLDGVAAESCADDCRAERPAAPSCSLSLDDLVRQQHRYAEIGRAAVASRRSPSTIEVDLSEDVDQGLVRETLEIEGSCCPFFELDFDADRRVLSIGVTDDLHRPALDAIGNALGR